MGRNVEIKAQVKDLESLRARVEEIAESGPGVHLIVVFLRGKK